MVATTESSAPLVIVTGVTGNQGGSVANALLESSKPYRIVGLTRDASKPKAQAFAERGVKIHTIDLTPANKAAVIEVFKDADYVFVVTDFIELLDKQKEFNQGKMLVDAAKTAGVKLFIWSNLAHVSEITAGKLAVAAFDSKGEVTEYLKSSGVPHALVPAGQYLSNYVGGLWTPKEQHDGTFLVGLPVPITSVAPLIDVVRDYGAYVRAVIENPALGAGSEVLTGTPVSIKDLLAAFTKVTGKTHNYKELSRDEFKAVMDGVGYGAMEPMFYDMFHFINEYGYYGKGDVMASHKAAGITPTPVETIIARELSK